jgi:Domain of unknown function (DUF4386)
MAEPMNVVSDSQRSAAKVAAVAFLILFALVVYANFGLRAGVFVGGDMAETVRRVVERQAASRLSVVLDLGYASGMVVLLSALYVVLSPVNRYLAAGLVFWALSSTLFGWVWLKSHYVPPVLALFGIVSSAWCVFCAVAYIMDPAFSSIVNVWVFDMPTVLFYFALSLWLLLKGLPGGSADRRVSLPHKPGVGVED